MTSRRNILVALGAVTLAVSLPALAQQQARMQRIGFLSGGTVAATASYLAAFRQGMTALRWVEGRDYVIDARYANNVSQAIAAQAAEIVATRPDLLLTPGESTAQALARNTKTVPIVFGLAADPVASGFARNLQRPGGNLTGMASLSGELGAKRLEVLRDAFPDIAQVAVLYEPESAGSASDVKEIEQAAARLRLRVTRFGLRQAADIGAAFKRAAALGINAYMSGQSSLMGAQSRNIADQALLFKIPGIAAGALAVEDGALMSYGPSFSDNFRRTAAYVDKILKGAKPGDLPIEQPVKFELVINMKTAKAMGLTIPQSILLRADRVIE